MSKFRECVGDKIDDKIRKEIHLLLLHFEKEKKEKDK